MRTLKPKDSDKENNGLEMRCQRCEHKWTYTGQKEYPEIVSCPKCNASNRLRKRVDR